MSDAPERICLLPDDGWSWMAGYSIYEENAVEYVRADRIATLEAQLEKAKVLIALGKEMYETSMLTGGGSPAAWANYVAARNVFADALAELAGDKDE